MGQTGTFVMCQTDTFVMCQTGTFFLSQTGVTFGLVIKLDAAANLICRNGLLSQTGETFVLSQTGGSFFLSQTGVTFTLEGAFNLVDASNLIRQRSGLLIQSDLPNKSGLLSQSGGALLFGSMRGRTVGCNADCSLLKNVQHILRSALAQRAGKKLESVFNPGVRESIPMRQLLYRTIDLLVLLIELLVLLCEQLVLQCELLVLQFELSDHTCCGLHRPQGISDDICLIDQRTLLDGRLWFTRLVQLEHLILFGESCTPSTRISSTMLIGEILLSKSLSSTTILRTMALGKSLSSTMPMALGKSLLSTMLLGEILLSKSLSSTTILRTMALGKSLSSTMLLDKRLLNKSLSSTMALGKRLLNRSGETDATVASGGSGGTDAGGSGGTDVSGETDATVASGGSGGTDAGGSGGTDAGGSGGTVASGGSGESETGHEMSSKL